MADFTSDLHTFKPSFSFLDLMDPNSDLMGHYSAANLVVLDNPTANFTNFLSFSNEMFFPQQIPPQFPESLGETSFPINLPSHSTLQAPNVPASGEFHEMKKRKSMDVSESSSGISTPQVSETGFKTKNSLRKGKRLKSIEKEEEKITREVVRVRARRGQATDSHSLAERVRRGKINERLRCLKDIAQDATRLSIFDICLSLSGHKKSSIFMLQGGQAC